MDAGPGCRDLIASATFGVITDPMGSPNVLLFASPDAPPDNDEFDSAATIDVTVPAPIAGTNVDAQHRTRGTCPRAEQRWNVGVVVVHRPGLWHGDAVDGRIDVRHRCSRCTPARPCPRSQPSGRTTGRGTAATSRSGSRPAARTTWPSTVVRVHPARSPWLTRGRQRRLCRWSRHGCWRRASGQGWRQRTGCSTGWVFAVVVR